MLYTIYLTVCVVFWAPFLAGNAESWNPLAARPRRVVERLRGVIQKLLAFFWYHEDLRDHRKHQDPRADTIW